MLACGRRFGKTTLGVNLAAQASLDGRPVGWFSPTYKLLAEAWRELKRTLGPVTLQKSETEHRLELLTGGVLECWSLDDADAGRGRAYGRVIVDEAAMVKNLEEAWSYAIRPTLTDLEGDAWFLSTPKGLNYFHALYLLGQDPHVADWASWRMPSDANPHLPPAELVELRKAPARVVAQEIDAAFVADGTGVFRGVDTVSWAEPRQPEQGHAYAMGVDWAGGGLDYTVVSVVDITIGQQVAVERFPPIDLDLQPDRLHAWAELYRPSVILAEANAMGQPLVQRLQRGYLRLDGQHMPPLPVTAWWNTNATKAILVQDLALAIENAEVVLLDDPIQRGELLAFDSERLPSGLLRYGAPQGMHDDTVIALMLAWHAAKQTAPMHREEYAFAGGDRRGSYGFGR